MVIKQNSASYPVLLYCYSEENSKLFLAKSKSRMYYNLVYIYEGKNTNVYCFGGLIMYNLVIYREINLHKQSV